MIHLNYLMDHIFYQIFKNILNTFLKKHGENVDNPSVKIYLNKKNIELHLALKMDTVLNFNT